MFSTKSSCLILSLCTSIKGCNLKFCISMDEHFQVQRLLIKYWSLNPQNYIFRQRRRIHTKTVHFHFHASWMISNCRSLSWGVHHTWQNPPQRKDSSCLVSNTSHKNKSFSSSSPSPIKGWTPGLPNLNYQISNKHSKNNAHSWPEFLKSCSSCSISYSFYELISAFDQNDLHQHHYNPYLSNIKSALF